MPRAARRLAPPLAAARARRAGAGAPARASRRRASPPRASAAAPSRRRASRCCARSSAAAPLDHARHRPGPRADRRGEHRPRARDRRGAARATRDARRSAAWPAAIVAYRQGYPELAWDQLRRVPREPWTRFAAAEYVRSGLAVAPDEALAEVRALVAEDPPEVAREDLVRRPRAGLRLRRRATLARAGVRASSTATSREDAPRVATADAPARLDARRGSPPTRTRRPRRAPPGRPHVRGHRLRPPRRQPRVGQHRRPRPEHRLARPPRPPPRRPAARPRRARRACSTSSASARGRSAARDDVDADLEVMTVHRDASMYEAIPEDTWVALLRLVHARAVQHAPRLPAAPQPAADLRLVPLQQARAADARGDRVPQALRAGRLPRLDDRVPAALDRRAGVLLGLPDDDDRHRVPGPRRTPPARRAARLRRHPPRTCPPARSTYQHSERRGPRRLVRRPTSRDALELLETYRARASRGRHLAAALLPAGALDRRRRRVPARATARTSASTGCSTSTTRRSTRSATGIARQARAGASARSSPAARRTRSTRCGASSPPPTSPPPRQRRQRPRAAAAGRRPRRARSQAVQAATVTSTRGAAARRRRRPRRASSSPSGRRARRWRCWSPRCSSTRRARCTSGCSALPAASGDRAAARRSASRR